jgi:transposase-like protein
MTPKKPVTCPHCGYEFTEEEKKTLRAKISGSSTSEKKKAASRLNGLKGGSHTVKPKQGKK